MSRNPALSDVQRETAAEPREALGLAERLRREWRRAFSLEPPALAPEDEALFDRIAGRVVERRLEAIAVFALESLRAIAPLASAAAVIASPLAEHAVPLLGRMVPVLRFVDDAEEYNRLAVLLERRENVETLIRKIEAQIQ